MKLKSEHLQQITTGAVPEDTIMHEFKGKWITTDEFCSLKPRNVFHRQLEAVELSCKEHRNRHILFRKKFSLEKNISKAEIFISADDYYKLWINGIFVCQGPAPSYHLRYNYNTVDITGYLNEGENIIAVHTLYQGLINRVWQSGDNRHGLILDLVADGETIVSSDETFLARYHSGFEEIDVVGYQTQFMEKYDSNSTEVGFEKNDYDDSGWENAEVHKYPDYVLSKQKSEMLVFEKIYPVSESKDKNILTIDFGSNYVAYLNATAKGRKGDVIILRFGQELEDDGRVRYNLRANCRYEEKWVLADGESVLEQFDYKSFRYAEIILPDGCSIENVHLTVRHYPFTLMAEMKGEYSDSTELKKIWDLCVHTLKYGVQEVIQDCMDREKGFYVGDGCYTALTHMILTHDDSIVRKLIDDGFASGFITEGLVTCLDCSFMQEIAEYPMMLIYLVLWHFRLTGDREYLKENYPKAVKVLESYRRDYEKDGLLSNLDKWCVVEWPKNFQDGYDVDIAEGRVCEEAHVSLNAYYIEAVRTVNKMAEHLGEAMYRDEKYLTDAFENAFYNRETHLFKDSLASSHISLVGNATAFGLGLCPDKKCVETIVSMIQERKISSMSFFCTFLALMGIVRYNKSDMIKDMMSDEGAWLRMLSEDATTTFEGWGKDTKWNTSLFHLTMSYGALFLADIDLEVLFEKNE